MGKRFRATLRGIFDTAAPILIPGKTTALQHLLKSLIEIQNHFINKMSSIDSLKRKKRHIKKGLYNLTSPKRISAGSLPWPWRVFLRRPRWPQPPRSAAQPWPRPWPRMPRMPRPRAP